MDKESLSDAILRMNSTINPLVPFGFCFYGVVCNPFPSMFCPGGFSFQVSVGRKWGSGMVYDHEPTNRELREGVRDVVRVITLAMKRV